MHGERLSVNKVVRAALPSFSQRARVAHWTGDTLFNLGDVHASLQLFKELHRQAASEESSNAFRAANAYQLSRALSKCAFLSTSPFALLLRLGRQASALRCP